NRRIAASEPPPSRRCRQRRPCRAAIGVDVGAIVGGGAIAAQIERSLCSGERGRSGTEEHSEVRGRGKSVAAPSRTTSRNRGCRKKDDGAGQIECCIPGSYVEADVAGRPCSDFSAFKGPDVGTDKSTEIFVIVRDSRVRTIDDLPPAKIRAGYAEYRRR